MKCLSCGNDDCAINSDGLCRDCSEEVRKRMEEARAEYEENNPEPISGIHWD